MSTHIAIEGQTFVGKSTLVSHLEGLGKYAFAPDYASLQTLPTVPFGSDLEAEASFSILTALDRRRSSHLKSNPSPVRILDRSLYSVVACHYAHRVLRLPSAWDQIRRHVERIPTESVVFDGAILLEIPRSVALRREAVRGKMVDFWMEADVRAATKDFYETVLPAAYETVLRLDGRERPAALAERAHRYLSQQATVTAGSSTAAGRIDLLAGIGSIR